MNLPLDASPDQSNCPPDYYRRNNGMLHQIAISTPLESPKNTLSSDELARLDSMTREELIALVKRIGGAIWGYAMMTREEKADAARLKLYNEGMTSKEVNKYLPALDKWFDREFGKAPQSIAMKVDDNSIDKISTDRLLRLAAMMDDPMIISPMPKKLDVVEGY